MKNLLRSSVAVVVAMVFACSNSSSGDTSVFAEDAGGVAPSPPAPATPDGGGGVNPYVPEPTVLAQTTREVTAIVVTATEIVFAEYDAQAFTGALRAVPIAGGAVRDIDATAPVTALALRGETIYAARHDGTIHEYAGNAARAVTTVTGDVAALAADATHVYWLEGGTVRRAPTRTEECSGRCADDPRNERERAMGDRQGRLGQRQGARAHRLAPLAGRARS